MTVNRIMYQIIDIESLEGLFTFQWRTESMDKAKMIECYSDDDIKSLYANFSRINRSMYEFSIGYDKAMLNALCKFVEKGCVDIVSQLRRVNNYFIVGNVNYFRLNREFWTDIYFRNERKFETKAELFKWSLETLKYRHENEMMVCEFIEEYPYLLGQSKKFKALNMIDVPKMLYYFSIRKDGVIRPSISLKNLQLFTEGYNIVHDFENIFDVDELKRQGMFEDFLKYSLNDVDFLFRYFEKHCLPVIEQRLHACEAIKKFNPSFEWTEEMIHSENNTNLLIKAFSLKESPQDLKEEQLFNDLEELTENMDGYYKVDDNDEIKLEGSDEFIEHGNGLIEAYEEDKIDFDKIYDNIGPTGYKEFDDLVQFVRENNYIPKDKHLKQAYCEHYEMKYNKLDEKTIEDGGKLQIVVGEFNKFNLFGTTVTVGLGGIHGAIENFIGEDIWLDDYRALYSSIVLQFKKWFREIINVDLYEALYSFRNFMLKPKLAELEGEEKITQDNEERLSEIRKEIKELKNLDSGSKLLLNSLYGLINSEFSFSVSNKTLGRFICLYGQYRAIELCKLIKRKSPMSRLININTDGVAMDSIDIVTINEINKEDEDGYLVLNAKRIDKIIQVDVNNYIKITNGYLSTKGSAFATGLKQAFCRFEKLPCNMTNALKYINCETKIEVLPVLFHQKSKVKSTISLEGEETSRNKVYYLTSKDKGKFAVKNIAEPIILSLDGEIMYFTTNKDDADIKEYIKFARITERRILEFRLTEKDEIPYTLEGKHKLLNSTRLKLNKIFPGRTCLVGAKRKTLAIGTQVIDEYKEKGLKINDVRKLPEVKGISIYNKDMEYFCVITSNEDDMKILDKYETFNVHHKSGKRLYVFKDLDIANIDIMHYGGKVSEMFDIMFNEAKELKGQFIPVWDTKYNYRINPSDLKRFTSPEKIMNMQ